MHIPLGLLVALVCQMTGHGQVVLTKEYIYLGDRILVVESGGGGSSSGYAFYRPMTINHTLVSGTHSNFPVLVAKAHSHFKSVSNGGLIQNVDGGKPADLAFFANSQLTVALDFEVDSYNPATGLLIAWVRIPSITSGADTVFYVAYGNGAITTAQDNPDGVWDSNFKFVGHMPNGTTLSAPDSTSFGNNGTLVNGPTATTGVGGAANLNSASAQHISLPAQFNHGSGGMTWSAWIKPTSLPNSYNTVMSAVNSAVTEYSQIHVRSDGKLGLYVHTTDGLYYDPGSITLAVGNWYYVAMSASSDANGSAITGYVNGVADGSDTSTYPLSPMTLPVLIGRDSLTTPRDWDGRIDEVRISNVARSADWILTEYNTQINPSGFVTMGSPVVP